MTIEQFITLLLQTAPIFLLKISVLMLLFLHLLFSIVLIKQTKIMIKVLEAQISPALYTISIIHFLFSLTVFIIVIFSG